MDWKNLKNNKCPQCEEPLTQNLRFHKCTNDQCDFICSVQKFNKIVNNLYQPVQRIRRDEVDENLSALNNM